MAEQDLVDLMVAAFRPHVRGRLAEQGTTIPARLEEALATGEAWLESELGALLSLPFDRQPRGPLEVFQDAMRFPTEALRSAGLPFATRDPVAVSALPGDVYDIAPASSRELGDAVWEAHLRWGAEKAAALRDG